MLPSLRVLAQRSVKYIRLHPELAACVDQVAPLQEVHSVAEVSIEFSPADDPIQFMDDLPETVDAVLEEGDSGPEVLAEADLASRLPEGLGHLRPAHPDVGEEVVVEGPQLASQTGPRVPGPDRGERPCDCVIELRPGIGVRELGPVGDMCVEGCHLDSPLFGSPSTGLRRARSAVDSR